MLRGMLITILLLNTLPLMAQPLEVHVTSPRPGLLFTDSEPVDVSIVVENASGIVSVEYSIQESEGPWHFSDTLIFNKINEQKLPLKLPGRGLYRLDVKAISANASATTQKWIGVVFTPEKPDPASPWGLFYVPPGWFTKDIAAGSKAVALSHRLLGASWSRLNFWAEGFGKITLTPNEAMKISCAPTQWKMYARDLRAEGISILGEIAQCPRELSSQPDNIATAGDAGYMFHRVKPADYQLWDQLMTQLAADFKDEIDVWEIWNEPNAINAYWSDTPENFLELVAHTATALRQGNPDAKIAVAGFSHGHEYLEKMLAMGIGKYMDILTVHYTDEGPIEAFDYRKILKKYQLEIPIWNTEERTEVPLDNLAGGVEKTFKFTHVYIGYPDLRPLLRQDLTALPPGIFFSVGAHCIGVAKFVEKINEVPGWDVFRFQRDEENILAFRCTNLKSTLGDNTLVTLRVTPLDEAVPPSITDYWGRSKPLEIINGRAVVELGNKYFFINGCEQVEVIRARVAECEMQIFEAETGNHSSNWAVSDREQYSDGRFLGLWADKEPGPDGYWAEVKINVPENGDYDIIFSGNSLRRLEAPSSLSSFNWNIDGGEEHSATTATSVTEVITGMSDVPSLLGTIRLTRGEHTFRLRLTTRRETPDQNYALWFDAIILKPVVKDKLSLD